MERENLIRATILATGPDGSAFQSRWPVRLDDGRLSSAVTNARDRTAHLVAFDVGQTVMVEVRPTTDDLCRVILQHSEHRRLKSRPVGRPIFTADFLAQRVAEAESKWADQTDRRCPECAALSPEHQNICWCCEYPIGASIA